MGTETGIRIPTGRKLLRCTVLIAALLAAGSDVALWAQAAPEATDAVEARIKAVGGSVVRDDSSPARPIVEVSISSARLTDETLAGLAEPLSGLPHLRRLTLMSAHVTDEGLRTVARISQLRELRFNCHVTGAGVAPLSLLPELTSLEFICSAELTDAALENLKDFSKLKTLRLVATPNVTDAGLKRLAEIPQLESLTLRYTGMTPQGLESLKELKSVRLLVVDGNSKDPVTDEQIRDLKRSLPDCRVVRAERLTPGGR